MELESGHVAAADIMSSSKARHLWTCNYSPPVMLQDLVTRGGKFGVIPPCGFGLDPSHLCDLDKVCTAHVYKTEECRYVSCRCTSGQATASCCPKATWW